MKHGDDLGGDLLKLKNKASHAFDQSDWCGADPLANRRVLQVVL